MHNWTFQREGPGAEMQGEGKSKGNREIRIGLSTINQAKKRANQGHQKEGGK